MGSWVVEMQAMLGNPGQLGRIRTSIYKVPPFISNINRTPYLPRVVSFGLYHHGEPQLASMEAHKQRALICCINRSNLPMQEVFDFIAKVAEELKDSYDSLDSKWQDDTERFVQLMILDGCFMLELLRVAYKSENYYSDDDPVFSQHGDLYVVPFIKADMLILENQLPMLLLLRLKYILENERDVEKLNKDILWLLRFDIYPNMGKCLHVLDLYRKSLLHKHNEHENTASQSPDQGAPHSPNQSRDQGKGKNKRVNRNVVRPATELHDVGIHFVKNESKSLRDITFNDGVLKLPNFIVDDNTESMFLNLIAFERCHIPAGSDITSFVVFMDHIIDNSRDIKLLSSKGIVNNFIGSDKEAANLFNTMSKDLIMEMTGNLNQVYNNLIEYRNTPWHNCLSKLIDKSCKQELANREMRIQLVEARDIPNNPDNGRSQEAQLWRMKMSIYKVPPFISNINKRAYQPRVVSFGPYHHGEPHLASMEPHKERALIRYIDQSGLPMQAVFNFVAKMAKELKDSYDSLDSKWQDDTERFVQLMILDGCFMLEVLNVYQYKEYYSDDDPIFSRHRQFNVMHLILADMLKLENQLPMSLLLTLKCILRNAEPDIEELNKSILLLYRISREHNHPNMGECLHVLDLHRKGLLHTDNEEGEGEGDYRKCRPQAAAPQSPDQGEGDYRKFRRKAQAATPLSPDEGEGDYRKCRRKDQAAAPQSPDEEEVDYRKCRLKAQAAAPPSPDQGEGDYRCQLQAAAPPSPDQEESDYRCSVQAAAPSSPDQEEGDYRCHIQAAALPSPDQGEGDYSKCRVQAAAPQSPNQGEGNNKSSGGFRGEAAAPPPQAKLHCTSLYSALFLPPCSHFLAPFLNKRVGHSVVRQATELHEAGVHFKKSESKSKSLRDITFKGGILRLPNFIVDDYTESMFLNLIAFERCHIPAGSDITSFVAFMDRIIDEGPDIKLLSSKGIITNYIGSDKEAANLFNTMSKDLVMEMNDNLGQVHKKLMDYSNTPWHKWRANLTQTYFKSPWAIISIIAAFLLFSLTIVQTIFTILN